MTFLVHVQIRIMSLKKRSKQIKKELCLYFCWQFHTLLDSKLSGGIRALAKTGISFDEARTYLLDAYHQSLLDFEESIPLEDLKEGLTKVVEYLCHPEPEKRGHPKNISKTNRTPNYDLERTISELDLFQRKAELNLYKK